MNGLEFQKKKIGLARHIFNVVIVVYWATPFKNGVSLEPYVYNITFQRWCTS